MRTAKRAYRNTYEKDVYFTGRTREYRVRAEIRWSHDPNADCDADGNRGHPETYRELEDQGPIMVRYKDGREYNVEKRFARGKLFITTITELAEKAVNDYTDNCDLIDLDDGGYEE